jgi:hypothetical protein
MASDIVGVILSFRRFIRIASGLGPKNSRKHHVLPTDRRTPSNGNSADQKYTREDGATSGPWTKRFLHSCFGCNYLSGPGPDEPPDGSPITSLPQLGNPNQPTTIRFWGYLAGRLALHCDKSRSPPAAGARRRRPPGP